jgi:hypothetical protein
MQGLAGSSLPGCAGRASTGVRWNQIGGRRDPHPQRQRSGAARSRAQAGRQDGGLRAIAQAAVDVELFTIPLYMTSLYSIQGMHAITGQGNDFYQGRLWPGSKTSANPVTANEQAFNLVFSVFIQEMLHLQMAANMATVLGVSPNFTDTALQDDRHGWTCYGPDQQRHPQHHRPEGHDPPRGCAGERRAPVGRPAAAVHRHRAARGRRPRQHQAGQGGATTSPRRRSPTGSRASPCRGSAPSAGCTSATTTI